MAYKDPADQRAAVRRHYEANKQYYKDKAARRAKELREFLSQAKSVPCTDCRQEYPPYVMDFDHREPGEKEFQPHKLPQLGSMKKLLAEIAKCDVVCANCHRERTFGSRPL
jgi:hypothetical protein